MRLTPKHESPRPRAVRLYPHLVRVLFTLGMVLGWAMLAPAEQTSVTAPKAAQESKGLSEATAPRGAKNPSEAEVEDILGTLIIEATRPEKLGRKLVSIAVEPSLDAAREDVVLHTVVSRDLVLSGEFNVLPEARMPTGLFTSSTPPDLAAWRGTGIEALIRLRGTAASSSAGSQGSAELAAEVYWLSSDDNPLFQKRVPVDDASLRLGSHRVADAVIGALTGHDGGFASHLTFTSTNRGARRSFTIDSDGHDLAVASGSHDVVSTSLFGPNDELLFAASVAYSPFRLYRAGQGEARRFVPDGSIYSVALDLPRNRVALALGVSGSVNVFAGPWDQPKLERVSKPEMAFHPAFSPSGKLAYVGVDDTSSRIYVEHKPVSPRALRATAPVFCGHPNGTQLVYSIGVGERMDLVASDEKGNGAHRLTQGPGTNNHPACSPDGRLVAFFSTRTSHEGPGLYVLPILGGTPKRISSALGDSLSWAPIRTR